ncbi:hypothetical protein SK128_018154 [Halocaridina rubra]|uniref:Uncharacterized protein n=1 Tax=Halocaridina rubra TaxID=373956 RepID=A0AAN8XWM0_HALRR
MVISSAHERNHKHFISSNNEILQALTWASLNPYQLSHQYQTTPAEDRLVYTDHRPKREDHLALDSKLGSGDVNGLKIENSDVGVSHIGSGLSVPRHRRRRTIMWELIGDVITTLDMRFIFPLLEVHEKSVFRIEVVLFYDQGMPYFIFNNNGRAADDAILPMLWNLEDIISILGIDGKACLERAICEVASSPDLYVHGFVGEVVNIMLRHITKDSTYDDTQKPNFEEEVYNWSGHKNTTFSRGDYIKAGEYGRKYGDCWRAYSDCTVSLFDIATSSVYEE